MKEILIFIINNCLLLFERYGFRFVDSLYSKSFGGDAYITIESEDIKMRFVFDRAQLLLEFSGKKARSNTWFSIDLISQFILGKIEGTSLLDERYAKFLVENMDVISDAFSEKKVESTIKELNKLARERAKRMFD